MAPFIIQVKTIEFKVKTSLLPHMDPQSQFGPIHSTFPRFLLLLPLQHLTQSVSSPQCKTEGSGVRRGNREEVRIQTERSYLTKIDSIWHGFPLADYCIKLTLTHEVHKEFFKELLPSPRLSPAELGEFICSGSSVCSWLPPYTQSLSLMSSPCLPYSRYLGKI